MKFKRIFLIVLDSLGIGGALDASKYGDEGANTLLHIIDKTNIELPYLKAMGLYNLINKSNNFTSAYHGYARELSNGKDTLTGHLEMMGIKTEIPLKTFTNGFPKELIDELEQKTGRKVIGNISASGTEIIERLGEEHIKTGSIIVYTSADSVLQIAAHESIIPINELYRICKIARDITLKDEWKVGRVIARPFIGKPGSFERTGNRHDYALDPSGKTILDNLKESNLDVISIGKISDIFNDHGITSSNKTKDNLDGINKIIEHLQMDFNGLCFANLNDFDSKYGHRRDVAGYAKALKEFDDKIEEIISLLRHDDLLMIVADHGNDPIYHGTDHTRENIPVLIYSKLFVDPTYLGKLNSFADIGATIADNFNIEGTDIGASILGKLK